MVSPNQSFALQKQLTDAPSVNAVRSHRFSGLFILFLLLLVSFIISINSAKAQVGEIIWEDNFDTFNEDIWTPDEGNGCAQGLCGYGNQEKQSYEPENVSIQPVPGEPGNNALALQAKREYIADQDRHFTSGKITTDRKLSVQYGMIEFRVRVPDLETGYWPAVWMLGTSTLPWPNKGEIDMMEMGHRLEDREDWLGRNIHPDDDNGPAPRINSFTGANLFYFAEGACNELNLSCAASAAYKNDNAYESSTPMSDRFVIYRTYWTPDYVRFTVEDNGVEQPMFQRQFDIGAEDTLAFREPFFLLMNMAVGGTFTGILDNDPNLITAPDNGIMYVDYIRVHKLDGHGTVIEGTGTTPETGTFGVFTDNTLTTNKIEPGVGSSIFLWDPNSSDGSIAPYEGDNVIAWSFDGQNTWFGGGVQTNQARDMSNFEGGDVTFNIKIPADVSFRIGVTDTFTNENWITFPAFENKYGLVRNGEWGQVTIPLADLRGTLIAIQSLEYMFAISSDPQNLPAGPFQYAVDNIVYQGGGNPPADSDGDGVIDDHDNCPSTPAGREVDADGCSVIVITPQTQRIQAQDYISFNDTNSGNRGKECRNDDVDVQLTNNTGGICNVGWTVAGEWLEYNVELGVGSYNVLSRVATNRASGPAYTVSVNGNVIGSDSVTSTGGWQTYETHEIGQLTISQANVYTVRVDITGGLFNLNWLEFNLDNTQAIEDSDGDGVVDSVDQCANTAQGVEVDSTGCLVVIAPADLFGATQLNESSVEFFVNTNLWADLHYTKNGGGQQNVRMVQAGGRNTFEVSGLSNGDQLIYWFTYLNPNTNLANDSITATYIHSNAVIVTDADNDGVADTNDNCPNTPSGDAVDVSGCSVVTFDPSGALIQAEDYADFFDTTSGNSGNVYRDDDVDIQVTNDTGGGYNVGWMKTGDWLEYSVGLASGTYDVFVRVASRKTFGKISLALDGVNIGSDAIGNTGGWQSWETHLVGRVTVTAGMKILRLNVDGDDLNLNWIEFSIAGGNDGGGSNGDSDNDGVLDLVDSCLNTPAGLTVDGSGCTVTTGNITPLFNGSTNLEPDTQFDRGDALITRFSDRPRTRHAREDQFQSYDHYIKFYFEHRSSNIEIIDYVAKGGDSITMNVRTLWPLNDNEAENRWWYYGRNTVAEYSGGFGMEFVGFDGTYYNYTKTDNLNRQFNREIRVGDRLEFEISQFSRDDIPRGQANYYGTTYLYIVGKGVVPWYTENAGEFVAGSADLQEDSREIPESYWLGGNTTLHYQYTNEPNDNFMQMATNLGYLNGQKFLDGRRLLHSSFIDGMHDEDPDNGVLDSVVNLGGTQGYINQRCTGCHERNGAAPVAENNELLDRWVFKVSDENGNPDPEIGRVLQPNKRGGAGEGDVSIAFWSDAGNGLRKPNYQFQNGEPERFSARIAPRLVGLGLLEAIPEASILAMEDPNDENGDGISGRANRIADPENPSITRLGRFGWKAATTSLKHQVSAALNTDMGVRTTLLPTLDCGSNQAGCSNSSSVLSDENVDKLVTYLAGLGVRPQRGWESGFEDQAIVQGKAVFSDIGCTDCHTPVMQTSEFHPLAEVRNQTIHPYSDMLLHDMGPDMADSLGEGEASGSEWRTTPLWGLGLSACVTGGVVNLVGGEGNEVCTPKHAYLHDGRARSIEEAILWHGGEGAASRAGYQSLSNTNKQRLLKFLESL